MYFIGLQIRFFYRKGTHGSEPPEALVLVTETAEFPSPLVIGGGCRIPVLELHPTAEHGAVPGAEHGADLEL